MCVRWQSVEIITAFTVGWWEEDLGDAALHRFVAVRRRGFVCVCVIPGAKQHGNCPATISVTVWCSSKMNFLCLCSSVGLHVLCDRSTAALILICLIHWSILSLQAGREAGVSPGASWLQLVGFLWFRVAGRTVTDYTWAPLIYNIHGSQRM